MGTCRAGGLPCPWPRALPYPASSSSSSSAAAPPPLGGIRVSYGPCRTAGVAPIGDVAGGVPEGETAAAVGPPELLPLANLLVPCRPVLAAAGWAPFSRCCCGPPLTTPFDGAAKAHSQRHSDGAYRELYAGVYYQGGSLRQSAPAPPTYPCPASELPGPGAR